MVVKADHFEDIVVSQYLLQAQKSAVETFWHASTSELMLVTQSRRNTYCMHRKMGDTLPILFKMNASHLLGMQLWKTLWQRLTTTRFFAILADEASDNSCKRTTSFGVMLYR